MLIRTSHTKEKPYVQINKAILRDDTISLKAKGLFAFLMANSDNWEIKIPDLCNRLKEGKKAILSALKELIDHGYCTRTQKRTLNPESKKWEFSPVEYTVYEEVSEEFKKSLPQTPFRRTHHGRAQNGDALRKNKSKSSKEDIDKEEGVARASPPPDPDLKNQPQKKQIRHPALEPPDLERGTITMSQEAWDSLCKDFGEQRVLKKVYQFSLQRVSDPKKYGKYVNHAMTIRNWLESDKQAPVFQERPKRDFRSDYAGAGTYKGGKGEILE